MRIAFVWQGVSGRYGQWKDGLYRAMQIIGKSHKVRYFEPGGDIEDFRPDWILYWEAPCTINGKDGENYKRICSMPFKKALLFAGGPIESMWMKDFDHVFIESQIDMDTCERLNIPHSRAFGVNDEIFKPEKQPKIWDGIHQCTSASWKRTWLMTEALKEKSIVCGRYQETDPKCFDLAREHGALVLPEQSAESVNSLLNASRYLIQTSEFWGGGQRATLEAMAAGIPPIVMSDSPKNREFVEESGFGVTIEPQKERIIIAVETIKTNPFNQQIGVNYIKSKWTAQHYANSILSIINQ